MRRTCGFSTSSSPIGAASPGAVRDDVEHAGGQAGLLEDLAPEQAADDRRLLRRLEHDRVAEHERRGDRAGRQDQRGVPRRDRADDADRAGAGPSRTRRACRRAAPRRSARRRRRRPGGTARARSASGTCRSRSSRRSRGPAARRPRPCGSRGCRRPAGRCPGARPAAPATTRRTPRRRPRSPRRASSRPPAGTRATTSPVYGSRSSKVRPSVAATHSPAMNWRGSSTSLVVVLTSCSSPACPCATRAVDLVVPSLASRYRPRRYPAWRIRR